MKPVPITRHLRIEGQVQGVGYRASMMAQARRLDVRGWVRNRVDGGVEAVLQGTPKAVGALVDWARQGPPQARVQRVLVSEITAPALTGFEQRATA